MRFDPRTPERAFPFYASTLDALEELPEERQGEVALVLLDFAFRDDTAAPFDCSEDDWVVLRHVFLGIIEEEKRFKIKQRFEKMLKRAELVVITANDPQAKKEAEARKADMIAKLKKLKWTASRDPDKVNEYDKPYALFNFNAVSVLSPKEAANARLFAEQFMELVDAADMDMEMAEAG